MSIIEAILWVWGFAIIACMAHIIGMVITDHYKLKKERKP